MFVQRGKKSKSRRAELGTPDADVREHCASPLKSRVRHNRLRQKHDCLCPPPPPPPCTHTSRTPIPAKEAIASWEQGATHSTYWRLVRRNNSDGMPSVMELKDSVSSLRTARQGSGGSECVWGGRGGGGGMMQEPTLPLPTLSCTEGYPVLL
jgi:hypothetical protein